MNNLYRVQVDLDPRLTAFTVLQQLRVIRDCPRYGSRILSELDAKFLDTSEYICSDLQGENE